MKALALALAAGLAAAAPAATTVHYRSTVVDGVRIFYREAGRADAPAIVLLHGFPSSSAMYRELIPMLAARFHVLAPDYPGYGHSDAPPPAQYAYTFDHLARSMRGLLDALAVRDAVLYMHDFGGPVGFRLLLAQPQRFRGLVLQNANAYAEGLAPAVQAQMQRYWARRTPQTEQEQRAGFSPEGVRWQYVTGAHDASALAPDAWTLDAAQMARPGVDAIQLDLLHDYRHNVASYPAWQAWLRQHQPRTLIVWGRGDPLFTVQGARAYLRDLPAAKLVLYDGGHFMLQEHAADVATEITAMFGQAGEAAAHRGD